MPVLTKKDIIKIIATVLVAVLIVFAIIWLIIKICPILIGAIVFIPWLGAALADGAKL